MIRRIHDQGFYCGPGRRNEAKTEASVGSKVVGEVVMETSAISHLPSGRTVSRRGRFSAGIMGLWLALGVLVSGLVLTPSAFSQNAQPLLPDIFPWVSESRGFLHDWVVEGDLLRFSTAFANQGAGHLEIRGGDILPSGNQEVYQRIYYDDGTFQDRLAGEFTYHSGHGHIHFDGYAVHYLRERLPGGGVGDIVASGGKISFCLIDITRFHPDAGSSRYGGCGQVQGVSAGWSDVYNRNLADQWINISNVPDGLYWLEVVIDPDNLLLETDPENNSGMVEVEINRGGSSGGDRWESNNSFIQPTNFGYVSNRHEIGLSIHDSADEDYFRVTGVEHGEFGVHLNFTHDLGNLDLFVYDADENLIASSTTTDDNEHLHFHSHQDADYFIVVRGVDGQVNGYDLELHGPGNLLTEVVSSSNVPVPIPDSSSANTPGPWAISTLTAPAIGLTDLNLMLDHLDHSYLGDLEIHLTSPAGTTAKILTSTWQPGGGLLGSEDDFINSVMDDQAAINLASGSPPFSGFYRINHANTGSNPLSVFNGENAEGTWTIAIRDWYPADTGTLRAWSIMFTGLDLNPGDRLEPNDFFPQAIDMGMLGQVLIDELTIHKTTDRDFFRFQSGGTGMAEIGIDFDTTAGNLELVVYNADLTEIARGSGGDQGSWIDLWLEAEELYYVEVFDVAGGTHAYSLTVDVIPQIGELGTLNDVTDLWRTVEFERSYTDPVVIMGPATFQDQAPGTVQIRNVNENGFEVRFAPWNYLQSGHVAETVDYLVIESGIHELPDGTKVIAGIHNELMQRGTKVGFGNKVTKRPIVLTQVASDNGGLVSVTRLDNIIQTGFWLGLQYEEQMRRRVESQDVHWLALMPDLSHREAWKYEAGLGKASSAGGEMLFSTKFTEMPRLFAAVQTMNERDPVSIRVTDLKSSHGVVILQEEQSLDPETSHQVELIGWVAATGDLIFSHSINRVQIRDSTFIALNSCRCHSTDRGPSQNRDGERAVPDRTGNSKVDKLEWFSVLD